MNINLADKKYEEEAKNKAKDPTGKLLIFLMIVVLILFGYLLFKKNILENDNERYTESIRLSSQKISDLTNSDNPAKKIMVSKIVKKAKEKRILWSEVMAKIIKLETPGISFLDFSTTEKGEVTALVSANDFKSISQFVANLNANEGVSRVILKGIGKSSLIIDNKLEVGINFNIDI